MTRKFKNKVSDRLKPLAEDDLLETMGRIHDYVGDIPKAIRCQKANGNNMAPINKILTNIVMEQHLAINCLENLYFSLKVEVMEYYEKANSIEKREHDFIDDVNTCEEAVEHLEAKLKHKGLL